MKSASDPRGLTLEETQELKQKEKLSRNRESALRCRQRKTQHVESLEQELDSAREEISTLETLLKQREEQVYLLYCQLHRQQLLQQHSHNISRLDQHSPHGAGRGGGGSRSSDEAKHSGLS